MKKVRWGIIGVGDVTEIKSGPAFNKIENSEVVIVMRRNLEKAKDYARRHAIPNFTNNADDVLKNKNVDAVYIATPPSSHAEYTIRAAKENKHVYVEKPMATTLEECQMMIDACKKNGVKLFVAYYRRELDYFKKIRELLNNNVIGEIKFVDIKLLLPPNKGDYNRENLPWRVNKEIAGGGYFYDLASHQFDYLDYIFGPIKNANGNSTNQLNLYDVEDIVTASFMFKSNIVGTGTWCFTMEKGKQLDRTEIVGSLGKLVFSFFEPKPIQVILHNGTQEYEIKYPQHVQQALIDSVVKDINESGVCISTGESAARTNAIMQQIIDD